MKKLSLLLIFLFSSLTAQEITWTDISVDYNMPEGVKLFAGERSSPILKIFYYDVDLNREDIAIRPYISSSNMIVPDFTKAVGAYGAINGGYFATGTPNSYSSVVYPGEVKSQNVKSLTRGTKSYPVLRSFFGMKENGSLSVDWIYHFGADIEDIYQFDAPMDYIENDPTPKSAPSQNDGTPYDSLLLGIGGGPTLVKDSSVNVTYNEEIMWGSGVGYSNGDPRTAVGFTKDNHVIMIVANGRSAASQGVSLPELAEIMLELGCVEAMNLDGGGSSQLAAGDKYVSLSSPRPVPSILAIVHKDSLNLPEEQTFEKIIDTGDQGAVEYGTGWFATANAGFYGDTKSLLNQLGSGSNYYTFTAGLPGESVYSVYGWWVASSNRCKDTPHIIIHKNGIDTVYADQTKDGSTWKLLGTYEFSGDSSEAVIVSDFGTQGDYIVADAIRFVSYQDIIYTGINNSVSELISSFELKQNYPNPFNPSTSIEFNLPETSSFRETMVQINVFDILGRKVKTLLNKELSAGSHKVTFNAAGLNSGIYFYTMNADDFTQTRKMLLVK